MNKIYLILCALLTTHTYAQFINPTNKDAHKVKGQILLVSLEEEDAKVMKSFKKDEKLIVHYKEQIEGNNKALESAVKEHWKFNETIEFMPASKANQMLKESKDKYALLEFGSISERDYTLKEAGAEGKPAGWSGSGDNIIYNPGTRLCHSSEIVSTIDIKSPALQFIVYMPNSYPSKCDIVAALMQMQNVYEYLLKDPKNNFKSYSKNQIAANGLILKEKTLLVDEEYLNPKMDPKKISEYYPYPIEITNYAKVEKAILDKDPKYAFLEIVYQHGAKGNASIYAIQDAADGKLYCYEYPKMTLTSHGGTDIEHRQSVGEKQIKIFAEQVSSKAKK